MLKDGDTFQVGTIEVTAVHTPGHTPEHLSFLVTDRGGGADEPMGIATADFVFVNDLGRPDLLESAAKMEGMMEPSARTLFATVQGVSDPSAGRARSMVRIASAQDALHAVVGELRLDAALPGPLPEPGAQGPLVSGQDL